MQTNKFLRLKIKLPTIYSPTNYTHTHTYTHINTHIVVVEGNPKAPFSIATTLSSRGRHSLPWIAPFFPWYTPYNAECQARRYQVLFLKSLVWPDLWLNPSLPDHWWTLYPQDQWFIYIYIYIYIWHQISHEVWYAIKPNDLI